MAKSKKKKVKRPLKTRSPVQKNITIFGNLVISMAFIVMLISLYKLVPAYKWVIESLVINNLKIVWNNTNLDLEQKYEIKLGFDARYINYIKQNTPENAIILMPPVDEFLKGDFNKNGSWGVKSKTWTTYFLYPRIVLQESDCEVYPELCKKISFVMIVNYWGYNKVDYEIKKKMKHGLLPIQRGMDSK